MPRLIRTQTVDDASLHALRQPRDDLVREVALAPDVWGADAGPVAAYERRLHVEPLDDGRHRVVEVTTYRLAVPFWAWLVGIPFRLALRRREGLRGQPWWAPPQRLDARQASVLARLTVLALVSGYLGTLLTQTTTFAAGEFGVGPAGQGAALATTRAGILVALVAAATADRLGRRRSLVVALVGAALVSVTTSAAPSMGWFTATQVLARGLTTGADVVRAVVVAEEMPAGARAYAISLNAMCAGLGSGMVVWLLPLADLAAWTWRLLFLVPLLLAPLAFVAGRALPESQRYELHRADTTRPSLRSHRGRLALLAASATLTAIYLAPAAQLQNEYLRSERDFRARDITLFTLLTSTPGGLGVFFGGRLADVYGRRAIGALGLVGGLAGSLVAFWYGGVGLWGGAITATVVGGMVVPALVVYGPELFPTRLRGRANGLITLFGVLGSSSGLLLVGTLAERWGRFGPAFSVVAAGPLIVALLVITRYPETAQRELEDLNPSDRPPGQVPKPPGPTPPVP